MQRPLTIGVLGHLGSIGSRHYNNFKVLGCKVIGCDLGGDPRTLSECDAVVIATPTSNHFNCITDYITSKQGSHIPLLVEKPIVATQAQLAALPSHTTILMVGYNLRFHSCVKTVRRWLGRGLIGRPLWARFTCAQYNDKSAYLRDGVLLNWSHEIDLALHLLGSGKCVAASSYRGSTVEEDMVDLIIKHDNNYCQTVVHLDYLTRPERRGFVIVGSDGSIDADLVGRQAHCKNADGGILHTHFGRDSFDGNYISEAKAFLALLKGQVPDEEVIGCTAEEALRVVDICFQAKDLIRGT